MDGEDVYGHKIRVRYFGGRGGTRESPSNVRGHSPARRSYSFGSLQYSPTSCGGWGGLRDMTRAVAEGDGHASSVFRSMTISDFAAGASEMGCSPLPYNEPLGEDDPVPPPSQDNCHEGAASTFYNDSGDDDDDVIICGPEEEVFLPLPAQPPNGFDLPEMGPRGSRTESQDSCRDVGSRYRGEPQDTSRDEGTQHGDNNDGGEVKRQKNKKTSPKKKKKKLPTSADGRIHRLMSYYHRLSHGKCTGL